MKHTHDLDAGPHEHDVGLAHDLPVLVARRRLLGMLGGGLGLAALAACGGSAESTTPATSPASTGTATTSATSAATSLIPAETAGPYPADGSNGLNVLDDSGVVRSDITSSFGSSTTTAAGVPLTLTLTVLDVSSGAGPLAGAAVYLWHCDIDGRYSLYDQGVTGENYLRGVQETGSDGTVTFSSVFPGCYSGRYPHVHFEVYSSVAGATGGTGKLRTSQLALPADACSAVYATSGYEASVAHLAGNAIDRDNVFSDGYSLQMATVTGSVTKGMVATLSVPV